MNEMYKSINPQRFTNVTDLGVKRTIELTARDDATSAGNKEKVEFWEEVNNNLLSF